MNIAELELFFAKATLPQTAELVPGVTIVNMPKFLESHIRLVKANPDNKTFEPYLERLNILQSKLSAAR